MDVYTGCKRERFTKLIGNKERELISLSTEGEARCSLFYFFRKEDYMRKVFISVGMNGRSDIDVRSDIDRACLKIQNMFDGNAEVFHNWGCDGPCDAGRLWYLGEAIKRLDGCDACYFVRGWEKYRGCKVEMEICKLYDIDIIEES